MRSALFESLNSKYWAPSQGEMNSLSSLESDKRIEMEIHLKDAVTEIKRPVLQLQPATQFWQEAKTTNAEYNNRIVGEGKFGQN